MNDNAAFFLAEDIHKSFGENEVLKGISMAAERQDVVSIIGSSGSGKSTFLRCLNFLEITDKGRIVLEGEEIKIISSKTGMNTIGDRKQVENLRSRLGMVFQGFNLWTHMTVLQNVSEARIRVQGLARGEARDIGMAFLDKVGIADKADTYPGFLSGGQQQRAAIARALAMRPEAILFDEPTSALDPELVGEVLAVMRQLAEEGTTMIVVTHEMGFARDVSNKALFLHEGKIEEQGDPRVIFTTPESPRLQQFLSRAAA